ncbi:MAG: tRNA dihydrouridine synthase DusB [Bacilli bacterium]
MKIAHLELPSKVILGPMAGVSNKVFREIAREFYPGLIYAEMVSDKAICYGNQKTLKMIEVGQHEHPITMQVFGGDVASIVLAAKFIDENSNCDIIDINMGCPVNKVLKSGGGSHLLKDPQLVYDIVSSVVAAVKKPVTVKIRAGFDLNSLNYLEIGKLVQEAGAQAIAIHGRTRSQFYEGKANWDYIKELKEHLDIPVIGNGDVKSIDDAIALIEYTKCDAIMISRASLGNPWLIAAIDHYFKTKQRLAMPTYHERIMLAIKHLEALVKEQGEKLAVLQMRSHAAWYLKGIPQASVVKQELNKAQTQAEMKQILLAFDDKCNIE